MVSNNNIKYQGTDFETFCQVSEQELCTGEAYVESARLHTHPGHLPSLDLRPYQLAGGSGLSCHYRASAPDPLVVSSDKVVYS